MARGKSINLFLMDGTATGRMKCTLANWTGVAYKIPRTELEKCRERDDLKQSGVYFLFGVSDQTGDNIAYIGQAGARKNGEGILYRLQEHKRNPDKDYWTEAVVFTTSNNSFGPTEISYLENRFCKMALEANRYDIKNGNDPTPGNITEEKESELEEFIDYAKIVMGTLGHKIFEAIDATLSQTPHLVSKGEEPALYLHTGKANATGKRTSDGFIIYAGSMVSLSPTKSCPDTILKLREKLADKIDVSGAVKENLLLSSPSSAAAFVTYASTNGNIMWKTSDGRTLKDIESSE
ncbi:GIY-YIG nuclease family protein [Clostridium sp. UBA1652]|uniref:GIY-YIG nuclease family protein n=1 Tax=Clostridium sp. UBA1652 TaxID=1946348 RepID=UPI00257A1752|nr:GIY-YIG nuclease family protein [Clostridium sp. UBA1652]